MTSSTQDPDHETLELYDSIPEESSTRPSTRFNEVRLLCILSFFAIVGVLARKGITVLTTYDGSFLGGVIWANFAACVVMGLATQSSEFWKDEPVPKAKIQLYTGITTGFCGTFSSFSSLILEAFIKSADIQIGHYYHYRNGAYGIMECASVMISHICISIAGLHFGKHLMKFHDRKTPLNIGILENVVAVAGIASWIAVIVLIVIKSWRSWTFACIVSPIACWTRFYVSKWLNPKVSGFPMGTFTVNVAASVILAILNLLNRGKTSHDGRLVNSILSCHMIQGLEDGFCGTLSTVSTFVAELYTLKSPRSYRYGFVSLAVSYILMLLILGSYNWTIGLTDPLCS
ncbi:CYFA0S01e14796g1_1 [Cyberlindnera fabianii]|uniref:CYFA0S01e14796g1_1 n=1 Tax=Cyberlindnera fabianii TaxID=36022 RepID=A0A061ASG7_CYBFA|nr:putative fluoride ion transporter CrcB [Cyberlindnera fabianii]CDR37679.1 CYFA0S01e14796g1_1 [Cyberlindnera fabianii]